jgi:hypothetical protein
MKGLDIKRVNILKNISTEIDCNKSKSIFFSPDTDWLCIKIEAAKTRAFLTAVSHIKKEQLIVYLPILRISPRLLTTRIWESGNQRQLAVTKNSSRTLLLQCKQTAQPVPKNKHKHQPCF